MRVADFEYELPPASIAQAAIEPRHSSRLLDTREMSDHHFIELPDLLRPGDLVVVNDTRVRPARIVGRRPGGGSVELLLLEDLGDGRWEALARPARRLRPGVVVDFDGLRAVVVEGPEEGHVVVEVPGFDAEAMARVGEIPLPPYFEGRLDDPGRYQTIFARSPGSAAAPTAGLHFTQEVLDRLAAREIPVTAVDLHVGVDTFRPMMVEEVEEHRMHREWCRVPEETARAVADARDRGSRVVAIGTTVVRALESNSAGGGLVAPGEGETDLFLRPGSDFEVVDLLVTNFHVPGSTLLVMVAAFMGDRWRRAYQHALTTGYRFLSFGDAMLAERP